MKVFVFDLLAYGEQLERLKRDSELPYPLPRQHFMPQEMFLEQIRCFAREVLPALKAHAVRRVPLAEATA